MKIYVVDDDKAIRNTVETTIKLDKGLNQYHPEVKTFPDAASAIVGIRKDCPDLVILDLMMPQMTGLDMLEDLGYDRDTAEYDVMILSAFPSEKAIIEAAKRNIDFFIQKPFKVSELVKVIREILDKRL